MTSFTYTISSLDNTLGPNRADKVTIAVRELPYNNQYFKCRVADFIINHGSIDNAVRPLSYFQLSCDNLGTQNLMSGGKLNQIIACITLVDGTMKNGSEFIIKNPNGTLLTFNLLNQLLASTSTVINQNAATTIWTLILELTPIEDTPSEDREKRLQIGKLNNF